MLICINFKLSIISNADNINRWNQHYDGFCILCIINIYNISIRLLGGTLVIIWTALVWGTRWLSELIRLGTVTLLRNEYAKWDTFPFSVIKTFPLMQDFERFNIHILLFLNRVTVSNLLISDQHYASTYPRGRSLTWVHQFAH